MTSFELKLANTFSRSVVIRRVSIVKEGGILWQKNFTCSFSKSGVLDSHADLYANVAVSGLAAAAGADAGNTVYTDFGETGISVPSGAKRSDSVETFTGSLFSFAADASPGRSERGENVATTCASDFVLHGTIA